MRLMTNNEPHRTDPAPADRDWFGGRRWTGIAAIGFVILVVLCVVLVLVLNYGNNKNAGTGTPGVSPTSSSTGGASKPASVLPTTVPTAAPSGTVWTIYQTVALPTLVGAGPGKVHGSIATGYAHTPLGALMATANEGYRYVLAPDAEWRQAAQVMLAPGSGTNAWLAVRAKNPYGSGGAAGTENLAQIAGVSVRLLHPVRCRSADRDARQQRQPASRR